jgi:hypothetical protein
MLKATDDEFANIQIDNKSKTLGVYYDSEPGINGLEKYY